MTWECEFFHLAGSWLACRLQIQNDLSTPGRNDFSHHLCRLGYSDLLFEEIELTREIRGVMREAGMLPAQCLARCAGRLLNETLRRSAVKPLRSQRAPSCARPS